MHEILGSSPIAPSVFGNPAPDSGNSEILALAGTPEQKERWLAPLLAGDVQLGLLDDRARASPVRTRRCCRRPRSTTRRRRVGHQRAQVVHDQRLGRRLPHRHGGHRPRARGAPARVDAHRPDRRAGLEILRDVATMEQPESPSAASAATPRSATTACASRRRTLLGAARRRLPARPVAARARPHPPLHALARRRAARVRHALRAVDVPRRARLRPRRQADGPQLDRRFGGADAGRPADDAARRLEDRHRRAPPAARTEVSLIKFLARRSCTTSSTARCRSTAALGYSTDMPLEAMYRYARGARLYDGPDEVHRQSSRARSCAATRRRPTASRPSTCRRAGPRRASSFATCSRS